jgi:GNAT superfamily N-acetyltransferase
MNVREKEPQDQLWIEKILDERWGAAGRVVVHGEVFDACSLPALVAGEQAGLATYQLQQTGERIVAELITLDAVVLKRGVGTALIEALISKLRAEGVSLLRVTTTNDNLDALRF